MESDQPASENPTDHHDTGGTGNSSGAVTGTASNQARSYECTFCKRGFSNAQALGGHMNIHRKDKAKLKQPPNSSVLISNIQQYSDNQKTFPFWPPPVGDKTAAGDEIRSTVPRQLPLLPEKPYGETQKPSEIHQVHGEAVEKSLSSDQASSPELDLELRLGPEPQDSSAATGTRKFF